MSISLPAGKRVRCIGCGKRINVSPAFTGRFADVRCKPCGTKHEAARAVEP